MARRASVCKTFLTSGTKFGSHCVGGESYVSRVAWPCGDKFVWWCYEIPAGGCIRLRGMTLPNSLTKLDWQLDNSFGLAMLNVM